MLSDQFRRMERNLRRGPEFPGSNQCFATVFASWLEQVGTGDAVRRWFCSAQPDVCLASLESINAAVFQDLRIANRAIQQRYSRLQICATEMGGKSATRRI